MKCPACSSPLTERTAGALTVDICDQGCGGIFFDRFELESVDDANEIELQAQLNWSNIQARK